MRNIFLEKSYEKCAAHINAIYCEKTVKKETVMNQHTIILICNQQNMKLKYEAFITKH